jgi:cobalt/nickel transport system permease protein
VSFHHLDQFAHTGSALTRVPPAGRLVGTVVLALAVATLPPGAWTQLGLLAAVAAALLAVARVPPGAVLTRLAWPLAFVLLASAALLVVIPGDSIASLGPLTVTAQGADRFATVMGRAMVALLPAVLLVSTTSFPELLHGLRDLRVPTAVATALGLAYRLLYLMVDELERLQRAARSRNAGGGVTSRRGLAAALAAATLGRAFVRADRTHAAMLARGFRGTLPLLHAVPWTLTAAAQLVVLSAIALAVAASARLP